MSMHLIGYETSASEAALTAITPIPDGTVQIQNNDVFVPKGMNNILMAAALINSAAATIRAQIQAPSLRSVLNVDIAPVVNGLVAAAAQGFGLPGAVYFNNPIPLVEGEPLDVFVQNGAAVMNRAFLMLGDGPVQPVKGRIYTVRCTAAATLATATWVNSALTFLQSLPAGDFQIVGFRAWSANGVAARLFMKGTSWRPGWMMSNVEANSVDGINFRNGAPGVLGVFNNLTPPSVDFMGITDTAQTVYLDLIKL